MVCVQGKFEYFYYENLPPGSGNFADHDASRPGLVLVSKFGIHTFFHFPIGTPPLSPAWIDSVAFILFIRNERRRCPHNY